MTEVFIILGLILLNGLFSMAEFALISARKARLEAQAQKGDTKAAKALALANNPDSFLSTFQIGITLIGILTGIFSGDSFKKPLQDWLFNFDLVKPYSGTLATVIIVIVITYLSMVFGELVPKRLGMSNPENIAKSAAGPLRLMSFLTHPFVWFLMKSSNFLVRILNVPINENQVTEEEIKAIISEGTEHGAIEEAEQEIIERVFHLGDRNITSLMTHRSDIVWIDQSKTVSEIKLIMGEVVHSIYPVCEGEVDRIVGVVSIKDFIISDDNKLVKNIMKPAMYVPEKNTAYQVLEKFKQSKIHHCFIVDEYGTVLGLITLNDILEAIVGDIPQPEDVSFEIVTREDGSYLIDAQIPFYDFLTHFDKAEWMKEGDQEFDTLAGFIIHELEKIPHTGEKLTWKIFKFEVVDMDNHRIDKVLVTTDMEPKEK